jgi:hypothetical protein
VSVAVVFGVQAWQRAAPPKAGSGRPGGAYIDTFKCGRGLNRLVLMGGHEDGFDQANSEPARINPARLPNPYLETIRDAQNGMMTLRDYDEGGQDKLFIDYFDVPRGIISAQLVMVQKPSGSQTYDSVRLGDLGNPKMVPEGDPYVGIPAFNFRLGKSLPTPLIDDKVTGLLVIDFATPAFVGGENINSGKAPHGTMLDYLNEAARPDILDLQILDDTAIDFAALVICQTPPIAKGTSFVEFSTKPVGPNVSVLSCSRDLSQQPCNPFQGDQACTSALPLACYKPSPASPPTIAKVTNLRSGEVRATPPVVGANFPDLASADAVCVRSFGPGWRVLAYHDGDGSGIATLSTIAPKTRLWIDVRDQQYANCWDREKPRQRQ